MVNRHTTEGQMEEMAGHAWQTPGAPADDYDQELRSAARRFTGQAQRVSGHARERVEDAAEAVGRAVSDRPIPAVMIAAALGFILGMIAFRSEGSRDIHWSARQRAR